MLLSATGDVEITEIWPHRRDGVPTKFYRKVLGKGYFKDGNFQSDVHYCVPLELTWNTPALLSALEKDKYLLPGTYTSEWSGVYFLYKCGDRQVLWEGRDGHFVYRNGGRRKSGR